MGKARWVVVAILLLSACGNLRTSSPRPFQAEYRVSTPDGSANVRVDLTYENGQGGTEQPRDVRLPWTYEFTIDEGEFLYVAASNYGNSATIRCEIWLDGVKQDEAAVHGNGSATCSGRWTR